MNIVVVDNLPSALHSREKRAGVRAALYVNKDFKSFKFFLTRRIYKKILSYSFNISVLKENTQQGNLARVKINGLKFNEVNSMFKVVDLSLEQAIKNFEENLEMIINSLRQEIVDKLNKNSKLRKTAIDTAHIFSSFIGPEFGYDALIELLIQHLLTKDIFAAAYGKTFHQSNAVAKSLNLLSNCFDDIPTLILNMHDLHERRDAIIQLININPMEKRFEIIKLVYAAFYSVYNSKDADRLGIVYTPEIAVDFIIRSTDLLMSKYLKTTFSHKNTHVIDPCVGTGTFMISLMNHMRQKSRISNKDLIFKYENELHANEVSILAYYIASMIIERTFKNITGKSQPFRGIVWRDTLLNVNLDDFPFQGNANIARMNAQQERKITAILGNPPYNAAQKNFGDGNPNPKYSFNKIGVDDKIAQTYGKKSQFQRQSRDMYQRFVRWASDRIGEHGIISFISNNSFVHANNYDGMRACLVDDFDYIYICDLRGNAYFSGERWRKEGDKFFGTKSRVGVAIYFLIKTGRPKTKPGKIYYANVGDYKTQKQKFAWIENKTVDDLTFVQITPDMDYNWIVKPKDPNYRKFIPLISSEAKKGEFNNAIFQLFTNGIKTGADSWQTNFNQKSLFKKLTIYATEYNRIRTLYHSQPSTKRNILSLISSSSISWYGELDKKAKKNVPMVVAMSRIRPVLYRPYLSKYFYYDKVSIQRTYRWPDIISWEHAPSAIPSICVSSRSSAPFECLAGYGFFDHTVILSSQIVPLYKIGNDGKLVSNVTTIGLAIFQEHYADKNITGSDIFYYCYAVLNDPNYIKKYGHEIQTLYPRIPLHPKFHEWSSTGKTLFCLHANFTHQPKYPLTQINEGGDASKFILKPSSSPSGTWKVKIDESLSIDGIPAEAIDPKSGGYVIGARTPIGWVLEYYQKACRLSTQFSDLENSPMVDFVSHRNNIIDLVYKLCTVSIETIRLQNKIFKLPHSFVPCAKLCCDVLSSKTKLGSKHNLSKRMPFTHDSGQKKL